MKTVCIIQARMGSTRLPGKIMQPILGKPMLWWDIHRVSKARLIDEVVIATTTETRDDVTEQFCRDNGWTVFRGSEDDVLDRYYQAAKQHGAEQVVRITSDCPLIEPSVIDLVVSAHLSRYPSADYTSNVIARSYPRGLDIEVFTFAALEQAWNEDHSPWREHVTPYLYRNPDKFTLGEVTNPTDCSDYRLTVDTPEDFALVTRIFEHFGHGDFTWQQVIDTLKQYPDWLTLNRDIHQKEV